MRRLLNEFDHEKSQQVIIQVDNKSVIALVENSMHHDKIKHIEIRYHFIKEKIIKELIKFIFVSTKNEVVDELTKSLIDETFIKYVKKLRLMTID